MNTYLLQLDARDEIGLRRALVEDHREHLLQQWRTLVADMQRTDPPPSKLEWPGYDTEDQDAGRSRITVQLSATWWGETMARSAAHPWVFDVRTEDGGWRVAEVTPFPWCGGYVYADVCR